MMMAEVCALKEAAQKRKRLNGIPAKELKKTATDPAEDVISGQLFTCTAQQQNYLLKELRISAYGRK